MNSFQNKVRIAIVSSSFPPFSSGGVSSAHYSMLRVLEKEPNFEVKGFTFLDLKKSPDDNENIIRSGSPKWFAWVIRRLLHLFFKVKERGTNSYQLADILVSSIGSLKAGVKLRSFKPDIVIVPDHGAPLLFMLPFLNAKFVWVAHHNPLRFLHNPLIGNMSKLDAYLAVKLESYVLKKCAAVIAPSQYMADFTAVSHGVKNDIEVIPNLLDVDFLDGIEPKRLVYDGISEEDACFIYIPSAGSSIKGERYIFSIMTFINSFLINNNVVFVLSGSLSSTLNFELDNAKELNVLRLGQIAYSDNISILKSCNLFISPTLLENYGMALLEATLCGIPAVSFDVGGNKEIIENGKNGFLVEYLDLYDLCIKSISLINNPIDSDVVKKVSREHYSISNVSSQLYGLINKLH